MFLGSGGSSLSSECEEKSETEALVLGKGLELPKQWQFNVDHELQVKVTLERRERIAKRNEWSGRYFTAPSFPFGYSFAAIAKLNRFPRRMSTVP